ncbi:MAG: hypothetical protein EOO90_21455 [Pedobacter sp.]|nr:MAG: hypothetical protein EOO90_21455 [Pedobacter sp.]
MKDNKNLQTYIIEKKPSFFSCDEVICLKVGDDFEDLRNSLPSYFDYIGVSGNTAQTMEHFAFVLQVQCGKIIRLEWARDRKLKLEIDGKLHDRQCP